MTNMELSERIQQLQQLDEITRQIKDGLRILWEYHKEAQFVMSTRKYKEILPWNAAWCEEKEIKQFENGQAV